MSIPSSWLAATTLALLAPLTLARAQTQTQPVAFIGATPPQDEDAYSKTEWRAWPATLPVTGQFRHCLAVRLTGYSVADAVMLVDQTPVLAVAPAIHSTMTYLPLCEPTAGGQNDTNDMDVLQGGGGSPSRDALALVGPAGLRILHRTSDGTFQLNVAQAGPWQSAQLVAAHPDDPNTIFGVSATGTEILVATRSGDLWSTSSFPVACPAHSIDGTARAIEAVRWVAGGPVEVALLTGTGVSIRNRDGLIASNGLFAGLPIAPPARSLTRVRNGDGECVAWLKADPQGGADLVVCGASDGGDEAWDLDGVDFVALAAADWTLDGRDDLFLTRRNGTETTLLVNALPLAPCVFVRWFGFRLPHEQAQHTAPVAVGDFDGDLDGDLYTAGLVAGGCGQSEFLCTKVHVPPHLNVAVEYAPEAPGSLIVTLTNYFPAAVSTGGPAALPVVANELQVVVWQFQGETLESATMAPSPLGSWSVSLQDPVQATGQTVQFTINLPPEAVESPGVFALLLRPVRVESGDVAAAGSVHTGLLLTNLETALALFDPLPEGIRVPGATEKGPLPPTNPPIIPGI